MSGGSFDYLYCRIEDDPLNCNVSLEEMADFLLENGQSSAAKELSELVKYLEGVRNTITEKITPSLLSVLRSAEWWCSGDIDRDGFKKAYSEHKKQSANEDDNV